MNVFIVQNETISGPHKRRSRGSAKVLTVLAGGEPFMWLAGGALVLSLVMIVGLLYLICMLGLKTFQPVDIVQVKLHDGRVFLGEINKEETTPLTADTILRDSSENISVLVNSLVQEVDDAARLGERIGARATAIQGEIDRIQVMLDRQAEKLAELLSASEGQLETAVQRRDWILKGNRSDELKHARELVETYQGQLAGLNAEKQSFENASSFFATNVTANTENVAKAVLEADDADKRIGIDELLAMVAEQRGQVEYKERSRSFRIGNYDLTGQHFHWIFDYQITEGGESLPEHATILERVSWGRFYGFPHEFVHRIERQIPEDEKTLKDSLTILKQSSALLSDDESAELIELTSQIEQRWMSAQERNVKSFLSEIEKEDVDCDRIDIVTAEIRAAESPAIGLSEFEIGMNVLEAQRIWSDPTAAWEHFESHHDAIRQRHREKTHLQKYELGHEYAIQEKERIAIRQLEIDHQIELLKPLATVNEIRVQLETLEKAGLHRQATILSLKEILQDDTESIALIDKLQAMMEDSHSKTMATLAESRELAQGDFVRLSDAVKEKVSHFIEVSKHAESAAFGIKSRIDELSHQNTLYQLRMATCDEQVSTLSLGDIVRGYQANTLSSGESLSVYASRWWEFLTDEPREANSEGGVLPAIWGTVTMTLIMSIAVVPFGVLAALYLREYAKTGPIVSAIRIAINNLAGVPSIVFGVFGLGFFCYIIGGYIDGGPKNTGFVPIAPKLWYLWSAMLAITSAGAFLCGIFGFSGRSSERSFFRRCLGTSSFLLWIGSFLLLIYVLISNPFFDGFYQANLPNPYWGKGGVLWAALTLALMTLPVVIVATEETLAAVPNSMREGSYGCGASKWQTIRRVVLPQALPGIMTGMILAMARGAGEVAPLMLVGAVKLAPELPIDGIFPYVHGNRSFMHLGFHVFDLGFQSQNSEAAKPMVYTTTLILIALITILNLLAIWLRAFLRKRFAAGQF